MFKVNGQIYTHQEMEEQAQQRGWNDPEFLEWLSVAQPGSVFVDEMNEAPELEACFTVECIADVPAVSEVERLRARNGELEKHVELLVGLAEMFVRECLRLAGSKKYPPKIQKVINEARAALKGE